MNGGYSVVSLGASYWLEVALSVVLMPTVCALWRPRGA
jgi:hypothetical protein